MDGSFEWVGPDGLGPSLSCIRREERFVSIFFFKRKKEKKRLRLLVKLGLNLGIIH